MDIPDLFINDAGRVRSVWRVAAFAVAFLVAMTGLFLAAEFAFAVLLPRGAYRWLLVESNWGFVIQSFVFFVPAALVGCVCASAFEDLPWRSLGWAPHAGWMRDLLAGLLVGALSIGLAALVGAAFGGYRFSLPAEFDASAFVKTLAASGLVFLLGAAAEEMLFRGYAFQTLLRSWPIWAVVAVTSVPFAVVHLDNPNVVPVFTFANTVLAGVWLGVAFWRTRSLWLALGIHWGWNWAQGALLGSPVSGITKLTPAPLLNFADDGPAWIGGGPYGIEGGAACTLALVISTAFVCLAPLFKADEEMKSYTDGERPLQRVESVTGS